MQTRHQDKEQYFREQVYTTDKYVIPFIRKVAVIDSETSILEIGCGEGGNLKPFLDLGCRVTGIDLSATKIDIAKKLFKDHPLKDRATFIANDIFLAENELKGKFDLIVMRDVIEHIHNQNRFMGYVKQFLKPEGIFFLAFPPWYNPFGGHQQICKNMILSKLPYYHLLPKRVYKFILKAGGEPTGRIDGLIEIKETGISIDRFEKILRNYNYKIILKTHYFINPNYQVKFGLRPRKQMSLISRMPFIRNFLITSCYYLIEAERLHDNEVFTNF